MEIQLPYGRSALQANLPDHRLQAVLKSRLESYQPFAGETELVEAALRSPIGSEPMGAARAASTSSVSPMGGT